MVRMAAFVIVFMDLVEPCVKKVFICIVVELQIGTLAIQNSNYSNIWAIYLMIKMQLPKQWRC